MSERFYVILTLFFVDGATIDQVVDIWEAVALDRALKSGEPFTALGRDDVTDLHYSTLREIE